MSRHPYLVNNRLEDVLFLIQHLGLGKGYSLEKANASVTPPRSASLWVDVARDHPEFFRVTEAESVTLAIRFYVGEGEGTRKSLDLKDVQTLIETAIDLHERQTKQAESFRAWGTFIAAVVAALGTHVGLFHSMLK